MTKADKLVYLKPDMIRWMIEKTDIYILQETFDIDSN